MDSVYKRKGCGPQGLGSPKTYKKQVAKKLGKMLSSTANNLYESTIGKVDTKEERSDLYNKAKEGYNKFSEGVKQVNQGMIGAVNAGYRAGRELETAKEGLSDAPDSSNKKKANCWKGYKAVGKKKSPSGKKTKGGKTKMVNNCVKIK